MPTNLFNKPIQQPCHKLELLESLRGIAALLIVTFHATELFSLKFDQPFLHSFFKFGDSGVDFFFVLSGFFLALSSHKYIGHPNKVKDFLLKRCIRLYPFYWLVSISVIPVYFWAPALGKGYETNLDVILKSLLLIPQEHAPILSVAWFLSHLIFFYGIFACVILWPKVASKFILSGLVLSILFSLADIRSGFQLRENSPVIIPFIFSCYNLEFIAGCWMGIVFKKIRVSPIMSQFTLGVGGFSFVLGGMVDVYGLQLSSEGFSIAHYYELIAYGLSSVLIVGGSSFLENNNRIKVNRVFLILGAASFSLYLTHYPILSFFTKIIQSSGLNGLAFQTLAMVLACVVTVVMGCLIHIYIEKKVIAITTHIQTRLHARSWIR